MHLRWHKERWLFIAALMALAAATSMYLAHSPQSLADAEPRASRGPWQIESASRAEVLLAEARAPRHSPFMPERSAPAADTDRDQHTEAAPPKPEPLTQPAPLPVTVAKPPADEDPAAFGYIGIASTDERACALIRMPGGATRRVNAGETLCGTSLAVERIEKQRVILKCNDGRTFTLCRDGLR